MNVRVLIVDDQALVRAGFKMILESEPEIEIVGEAEDGESGVAAAARLEPAIVLLDVQLPDIDGFEVARRLDDAGHAGITVLVSGRTGNYRRRAAESPVVGFLLKGDLTGGALAGLVG